MRLHLAQVMLGVDRLDMIKGIPQKLLAFEKFLDEHPEWSDRVILVQIAVPSRMEVPEYQVLPPARPHCVTCQSPDCAGFFQYLHDRPQSARCEMALALAACLHMRHTV